MGLEEKRLAIGEYKRFAVYPTSVDVLCVLLVCFLLKPWCSVWNQGNGIDAIALNQSGFTAGKGSNVQNSKCVPCRHQCKNAAGNQNGLECRFNRGVSIYKFDSELIAHD